MHSTESLRPDAPSSMMQTHDVSQGLFIVTFAAIMRSLLLDFMPDALGNAPTGSLAVYMGTIGSSVLATLKAGSMLSRPISGSAPETYLTIVPAAGSTGLVQVTLTRDILAPGRW